MGVYPPGYAELLIFPSGQITLQSFRDISVALMTCRLRFNIVTIYM